MSKQKHFYSHLALLDPVIIEINNLEMSDEERTHLTMIVQTNLHYIIVDLVLSHLATVDKKIFVKHLESNDHERAWTFLKEKTENIEEKIKNAVETLKKELLADIKKSKENIKD